MQDDDTPKITFNPRERFRECPEVHVAGVCIRESSGVPEILLAKRADWRRIYPGLYEGCGGQIQNGEYWTDAVERHYRSEMGIEVKVLEEFYNIYGIANPVIPGVRFLCLYMSGMPISKNHTDIIWINEAALSSMPESLLIPGLRAEILQLVARYEIAKLE